MKNKQSLDIRAHVTGSIPHWIREEIQSERLRCSMASLADPFGYHVGDAEVVACLLVNAQKSRLNNVQQGVYLYLAAKLLKRKGQRIEAYMYYKLKNGMTVEEKRELKELRKEIYLKGGVDILFPASGAMNPFKKLIKGGEYES